ncbi:metallophosphoesterase [Jatrophihabitans sp. YIM 134969]
MEHEAEQLPLPLPGLPPTLAARGRRFDHRRALVTTARVVVAAVLGIVLAGVAVVIVPYRTSIAGVEVTVTATAVPSKRGITVDSSLGSLVFRHVTAVPLGLHIAPQVDLDTVRAVTGTDDFADRARSDLEGRIPWVALHFGLAALLGLLVGALAGRLLVDGALALAAPGTGQPRSPRPGRPGRPDGGTGHRVRRLSGQVGAVSGVVVVAAGLVGGISYDANWVRGYQVTGLLADVAATPDRLAALDARDSNAAAKIRAVLRLQDAITAPATADATADTAYRVLFISDVHRRNIYPYLQQYIAANDVAFIVNTGDETLVGQAAELTPDYVNSIAAVTRDTPMLWIKGNHDSTAVADRMDAIPGVTVLTDQIVTAFGLQVYGTPDPRTYGASGELGSDNPETVTRVQTRAAADALDKLDRSTYLDLLLAHEPVEADLMSASLGPTVRAQASGHVHRQNAESDLQRDGRISLVEGTTGLGGLLRVGGDDPMSFSILSVAPSCQFTRIVRYQLADPALSNDDAATSFGENSSFVVHYFDRQNMAGDRTCSASGSVSDPRPADDGDGFATLADWGPPGAEVPTDTDVPRPDPISSDDETGDADVNSTPGASGSTATGSASPTR